jgi:hypothetical protein
MGGLEEVMRYETTCLERGGVRERDLNSYMQTLAKTYPYEFILYISAIRKLTALVRHSA